MTDARDGELEAMIRSNYDLWNAGKADELTALFNKLGPNGYTIEYVGSAPQDGARAMTEMWATYGGKCTTEAKEVLVNGNEGAAYVLNHLQTDKGVVVLPSLETYKVEGGKLHIRYFHRAPD